LSGIDACTVLTMPVYNEAAGIQEFLAEIASALGDHDFRIVVIDDNSTDKTREVLAELESNSLAGRLWYRSESVNRGHGPTTVLALQEALNMQTNLVVAVDGDGQFLGTDLKKLIEIQQSSDSDVCEGVRQGRREPWFRRITTMAVRLLVAVKARSRPPRDANTPLRVYRSKVLVELLRDLPDDCLVPNLVISAKCRRRRLRVTEVPVKSLPRRGGDARVSTMFGIQGLLPTKRFVRFVSKATVQFLSMKLATESRDEGTA